MIRCLLFLDPGGMTDPKDWELLGKIEIENLVETTLKNRRRGDYAARIFKKRGVVWKRVKVKDFLRLSYHPWNLIYEILDKAKKQNGGTI